MAKSNGFVPRDNFCSHAQKSLLDGESDCVSTIGGTKFAHQMSEVSFDGIAGESQYGGDFLIRFAFGDEAQDLDFAIAQTDDGILFIKSVSQNRSEKFCTGSDAANRLDDDVLLAGFRNVTTGTRFESTADVLTGFVDRNEDDFRSRIFLHDLASDFHTMSIR